VIKWARAIDFKLQGDSIEKNCNELPLDSMRQWHINWIPIRYAGAVVWQCTPFSMSDNHFMACH